MVNKVINQKRVAIVTIILALLCLFLSEYTYADGIDEQKNVLIINSYNQGLAWTKDETDGIIDVLKKSNSSISISVEFIDWKNYPTEDNMRYLYDYYKYKYQKMGIDILIVTDDTALDFALKNRSSLFSDAPVVFCGVNQSGIIKITSGYKNFTGVIEEIDPTDTIKMALEINPSLHNIYILFDNSESGISTGNIVMDRIKSIDANLNLIPLNSLSYDKLIKSVRSYTEDSIILATTYYSDVNGKILEFEGVSREISKNSSVPVYHLFDFGLNNGAFGGTMMSGKLQGMGAANLALRIINGENPDDISILSPGTTRTVFDFQQLKRFNVPINKIPKDSELINKPFSFFETYRTLVLSLLAAFAVLITFINILLVYIKRIRKMSKNLADSNEEITQVYEELEASDEELKQQLDEILLNHEKIRISEENLTYLAYHDSLTELPNKRSLFENSNENIFILGDGKAALLFIDIDNLKYINDTMGHAFGDQIIIKVSERLSLLLKKNCSIFRLSGDEFIIIMKNIKEKEDPEAFTAQILEGFKEKFNVINSELHISLSIGIVLYPEHGGSVEELLKYADIAMYKAKETGRNKYVLYDLQMNEALIERMTIEKLLHTAMEKNEFELYYQAQLDLKQNKITGFEALLRWNSLELGFVSPLKFIKAAEDTHIIIPLGTWVIRNACAFLNKLHKKGYADLIVSVNISILQLLQDDFEDIVMDTLKFYELKPCNLELEITESILIESFDAINKKLEGLSERGVGIALDDFGKGYSSLTYLKQMPITTLKIDKSFIDDIYHENKSRMLISHIVKIGNSLGIRVIAEGVESQEQLEYLIKYGCHEIQGYYFSKPIPEGAIEKLLEKNYTS